MSIFPEDARFYLRREYEARHVRNPSYSWRSYARDLKLSPSMLSEFLKGRYGLSRAKATQVSQMLHLESEHTEHFIDLLEAEFHRADRVRKMAKLRIAERTQTRDTHVSREILTSILDWTYFALLEVAGLDKGKISEHGWSQPFRSAATHLQDSLRRLVDLKLLRQNGDQLIPSEEVTIAGDQLEPAETQKLHSQVLDLAQRALTDLEPHEREATSVFGSIHEDDFAEMKSELNDTFLQILNKYSARSGANSVYCFTQQVFPVYRKEK